jgi:hypothetical protein
MRKFLVNFSLFLLFSSNILTAQTIVDVLPGNSTLENAIKSYNSGDILQLTGGGEYTLSTSVSTFGIIDKPLTIRVKEGSTQKAIIKLASNAPTNKKYYYFTMKDGGSLTLKGLDISGIAQDTAVAGSMILFDARPTPINTRFKNFHFVNCDFHDFMDYIVNGMKDDYARGSQMDSIFVNGVTVYNANHFLEIKHVSLHHLEMSNSTVYNMRGMAVKIGKIGYRCVLLHPNQPYIPLSDSTITPTGFIDHCTMNNLGDIHGHIQVDNAFHTMIVSNCLITNQQQFNQPAIYFLTPYIIPAVIIKNTCFWKCAPPNSYVGGTQWIGYQFQDSMTLDPHYKNASIGDFTLPLNSPLLKAGTDGGPIGDLRWTATSTSVQNIQNSMNTISENYPNPFQSSTTITFTTNKEAVVSIDIFNASGIKIETLINENRLPGTFSVRWDAKNWTGGIYFYQLKTGEKVETKKMILY